MNIACISTSQVPSTTANSIQVMKVCHQMQQMGHQVCCLVPGKQRTDFDTLSAQYGIQQAFRMEWMPAWNGFKRYDFALRAVLAAIRWEADVIYTWTPQAALISSWLRRATVLEMHDRATGRMGLKILKGFVQSHSPQNQLVCVTRALKAALEGQMGVPIRDNQVVIAPNGVDTERYQQLPDRKTARAELNLLERFTVSYTGHFYPGRGQDVLFALAQAFPQVNFLWVGGREPELTSVRNELVKRELTNVHLTGFVNNQVLPMYQAAADVLLMPYERSIAGSSGGNSADICSPMKMFEYMAVGNPIITSDLPVIREVLDETSAFFCPPEGSADWIETLRWIMANPTEADSRGQAAKKRLESYQLHDRQGKILARYERIA